MIGRLLFFVIVAGIAMRSCGDDVPFFISRGFEEHGGVAAFFGRKTPAELKELRFHPNLKVCIYAAWVSCQQKCLSNSKLDEDVKNHRHEFLGFLSAKLSMELPAWWRKSVLELAVSEQYAAPSYKVLENTPKGFKTTDGVLHADDTDILKLEAKELAVKVRDEVVKIQQQKTGWDFEDSFVEDYPAVLDLAILDDQRKIFGIADKYQTRFNVFCVDRCNNKLWSAEVKCMDQYSVGGKLPSASGLLHFEVGENQMAVFWVNEAAISLTLIAIDTGEILTRFTTSFVLPRSQLERIEPTADPTDENAP